MESANIKFNIKNTSEGPLTSSMDNPGLKDMVGVALLDDLNQQLSSITERIQQSLAEKQNLRAQIQSIYQTRLNAEALEVEGQSVRRLSPEQASLLAVTDLATPLLDGNGSAFEYQIKEEDFQAATQAAMDVREESLSSINETGEITMLKIQSLIDQRKMALTLMSTLIASSGKINDTIISNIRN